MTRLLISLLLGLLATSVYAAEWNLTTCSQSEVQSAITSAANGDTINIPADSCTWSTPVNIANKEVYIIGAGIDATTITDDTGTLSTEEPFYITNSSSYPFRISGITFAGIISDSGGVAIKMMGDSNGWRIDHCKFIGKAGDEGRGIIARGYGLIDNNIFIDNVHGIDVLAYNETTSWSTADSMGTVNAVYVEDNVFDYSALLDGAIDAYEGGRYVFRFNEIYGTKSQHHGLDSGSHLSTRHYEVYHNTYDDDSTSIARGYHVRGGTGRFFNNTFTSGYSNPIMMTYYRSCCDTTEYPEVPYCSGWGRCDGDNEIDQNSAGEMGYRCYQQPGTGTNGLVLDPIYEWNNTKNGADTDIAINDLSPCASPSPFDHMEEDRDYYNSGTIQTSSSSPFDGTTGVGFGTVANRPSTCTTGVAYWATDEGEWNSESAGNDGRLYECTSTDTWAVAYTPYIYPHPLRGNGVSFGQTGNTTFTQTGNTTFTR